ncbi:MAG: MMPL family transporter [Deltaproteobacteria bacterium]|nr:MMPL family transporter [Deltaproteobacteria bacterium]
MPISILHRVLSFSTRHAAVVVLLTLAVTGVFGFFAARVRINPNVTSLLPEHSEASRLLAEYSGGKPSPDVLVVAVRGPDLFSPDALQAFSRAIDAIAATPGILSVVSPFSLPGFRRAADGRLAVAPIADGGATPADAGAAAAFRERLFATGYARNLVVSRDGTVLAALFQAERRTDHSPLMREVRSITDSLERPGMTVLVSGLVAFSDRTGAYLSRDVVRLTLLAALVVLVSLYLGFRSKRSLFLPITVVILGTVWSLGLMGMLGFELTLVSIVAPPLILIFGNEYAIYVMNAYYRLGGAQGRPPGSGWIADAVTGVGAPIAMAFFTTMIGFLSLLVTDIPQTRQFAVTASFGSLACGLLALVFLPALLSLFPPPDADRARRLLAGPFDRLMTRTAGLASRWPLAIIAVVPALGIALAVALRFLSFNTDAATYYPQHDPVIQDMYALTEKLGGFDELHVTWTAPGGRRGYFLDPLVLRQLAAVEDALRGNPDVCWSISFPSLVRDAGEALGEAEGLLSNRGALLYFSRLVGAMSGGSGAASVLGGLADDGFTRVTLTLRIYNSDTGRYIDEERFRTVMASVRRAVAEQPVGDATAVVWGPLMGNLELADLMRRSLLVSMLISYASIWLLASIVFRSPLLGLAATVPLGCGLMLNFIGMALFGIPLDMTTLMVANVTIGVGIDNGIYLTIEYRRQLRASGGRRAVVIERTLRSMGRSVVLSTASIVAGLAVFASAAFRPVVYFGLLVIFSLGATAVATLLVLPALLAVLPAGRTHWPPLTPRSRRLRKERA